MGGRERGGERDDPISSPNNRHTMFSSEGGAGGRALIGTVLGLSSTFNSYKTNTQHINPLPTNKNTD